MIIVTNKFLVGVVADDITGANDIGVMFSKYGYITKVYTINTEWDIANIEADVFIIDTDSRFDNPEIAYDKVRKATRILEEAGCQIYINKTCSVFRGNIGVEFDAMLDELKLDFAPIVLGFPKNGRVTRDGVHYVHGKLLEDSEFSMDPIHPMKESSLISILEGQTDNQVSLISHEHVEEGPLAIEKQIEMKRKKNRYVIFDVSTQEDLTNIAKVLVHGNVVFGSSAIAEELPPLLGKKQEQLILDSNSFHENNSVLLIAGSVTPQSRKQVATFKKSGNRVISLNSLLLLREESRVIEIERVLNEAKECLGEEIPLLIHVTNEPEDVKKTQKLGEGLNLAKEDVGQIISSALSVIVNKLVDTTRVNKLIIAGGDTSAAICQGLEVKGLQVLHEIEPGLPSCRVVDGKYDLLLVLKSGSFGKPDFFSTAINHLKEL